LAQSRPRAEVLNPRKRGAFTAHRSFRPTTMALLFTRADLGTALPPSFRSPQGRRREDWAPSPRLPHYQELFEDEILREHGPDPTNSQNSDQTGQQAQDRPEPGFHFNHFAREHKQSRPRLIRLSGRCNSEFAMHRPPRTCGANPARSRRFSEARKSSCGSSSSAILLWAGRGGRMCRCQRNWTEARA
jgi:hypothetical protein